MQVINNITIHCQGYEFRVLIDFITNLIFREIKPVHFTITSLYPSTATFFTIFAGTYVDNFPIRCTYPNNCY